MSRKTNSNLTSILVVVCSIIFIVIAIFVLNETFRSRSTQVSQSSTSSSDSISYQSYQAAPDPISKSSSSRSTTSNSVSSNTSLSASASSTASAATSLQNGELIVKYLGGTEKNFEIVECKLEVVYYCKAGVKLTLSSEMDKKEGDLYKLVGGQIEDTAEGLSLSGVKLESYSK